MRTASLIVVALGACTAPTIGQMRFVNQPVHWEVDDRRDTPVKPEKRRLSYQLYLLDAFVVRRLTRVLEVPEPTRARGVNALDEVPDSTWFTNRVRGLTADAIRRGPGDGREPEPPWRILGTKVGGVAVGFLAMDSAGERYLLKFDAPGLPELETATDVVVDRLLWAVGYNVPDDSVLYVTREQMVLDEEAVVADVFGNEEPMTVADLEKALARTHRESDGRYRILASKLIRGIPIGGFANEGVRPDDPNDVIPHEDRRDLRGMKTFFAWLGHTDVKDPNTLDTWVEEDGRHYVEHYLIDFGKALGALGHAERLPSDGFAHFFDWESIAKSLVAFGLWARPWEGAERPNIRGVGRFESDKFDIDEWRPRFPYPPFARADRFDGFWAARILLQLSVEEIRAAVEQGHYTDPRAVDYLTEALVTRQRKIGRAWLSRVNPASGFELAAGGLCFVDLNVHHGLDAGATYQVDGFDFAGQATGWSAQAQPEGDGRVCVAGYPRGATHDDYTILRVRARRTDVEPMDTLVHLARAPDGTLRIIGVRRY